MCRGIYLPPTQARAEWAILSHMEDASLPTQVTQKLAIKRKSHSATTALILCYQPARSKRLPPSIRVTHEGK